MVRRLLLPILLLAGLFVVVVYSGRAPAPRPPGERSASPAQPPQPPPQGDCARAASLAEAARSNVGSFDTLPLSDRGRAETGWAVYAPLIAHELGTTCPPDSPGFAAALAAWQKAHGLIGDGAMNAATMDALRLAWLVRRPFAAATRKGGCPPPPAPTALAAARPEEGYGGKAVELRRGALEAYRSMAAAARREIPALRQDRRLLTIASGYRGPQEEAARCAGGGCGSPARASCSAHRTGLAADLYLGAAPGADPFSSDDRNRLYLSRSPAYRWLVANAGRFGFTPYAFEPWHWEWTGEAP